MKTGSLKRAIGVTFIYIGVFVLLVFVQFSRSAGFSFRQDRLSVSASFSRGEQAKPESLRVNFAGLSLETSPHRPLLVMSGRGASKPAALLSVQRTDAGVRAVYEGGVELFIEPTRAEGLAGLELRTSLKPAGRSLSIPYSVSGKASLAEKEGLLVLAGGGGRFALSLPASAFSEGYLQLGARLSLTEVESAAPGTPVAPPTVLVQAPKDEALFRQGIDAWVNAVWAGLSSGRFDAARLAWRDAAGTPAFSEKAMTAYAAEAFRRGSGPDALTRIRPARQRYPGELTHLSVPFLGDTIRKMQELEVKDAQEVRRLQELILAKNPSLFEREDLIHWLMDRSPYTMAQDALRFAGELDVAKLDLRQSLGVLSCVVESRSYLKPEENPFASLGGVADRVAAAVRKTSAGYFLAIEEGGMVDLRLSLVAGLELIEYGKAEGKAILVGVGQSLVEGYLSVADPQGFAPARAVVRNDELADRSGSIAPEETYPLLARNPYYPREVSFYREAAPGVWAWTCAPNLAVSTSSSRYTFTADFPVGLSHFMAIYGVKPFVNIKLYGINYSPDAEFEIYNVSGYLYRKASNALYLKMRHKTETEAIDLTF